MTSVQTYLRFALMLVMLMPMQSALAQSGDTVAEGARIFDRTCALCHSIDAGENRVGPSLAGVVGRPAGQVEGYAYSDANRKSGIVWNPQTLDTYLANPRGLVPGTKMTFPGLKDPVERAEIIGYLKSRGTSGSSTPPS